MVYDQTYILKAEVEETGLHNILEFTAKNYLTV